MSLLIFCNIAKAYECDQMVLNSINDKQIIDYNPLTKKWSRNLGLNDYVFTKHITIGTGGFSEYIYKDKNLRYKFNI